MDSNTYAKELAEALSERNLKIKLQGAEHDFVERKSKTSRGDWIQAAVAFANSAPIGWPAVLFVGVSDDGVPELVEKSSGPSLEAQLESLQKSISDTLDQTYPPFYRFCIPLRLEAGGCVAVVIPGSDQRPHFAGRPYVRRGPSTKPASEAEFENLMAERNRIVYELRRLISKPVLIEFFKKNYTGSQGRISATVHDCNQHYLTYRSGIPETLSALPVGRVDISFDHRSSTPVLQTWEP